MIKEALRVLALYFSTLKQHTVRFSQQIQQAKFNFPWLSILISAFGVPYAAYKIYRAAKDKPSDEAEKALRIVEGVKGLVLTILGTVISAVAILMASPLLILLSSTKVIVQNGFDIVIALYDRFKLSGRADQIKIDSLKEKITDRLAHHLTISREDINELTRLMNHQQKLNQTIIVKTHSLFQSAIAFIGIALNLTPAAPAGMVLVGCIAAYSIADSVGANPLKWAMRLFGKSSNDLFVPKTGHDIIRELKVDAANKAIYSHHDTSSSLCVLSKLANNDTKLAINMTREILKNKINQQQKRTLHQIPKQDMTLEKSCFNEPPTKNIAMMSHSR